MSQLHDITTDAEFRQHITSVPTSTLLVLNFHAPWAAPCAQMKTILTTLASTYPASSPPTISFLNLDAEELADISESYDVSAVPFLVLQRDGQVLESISGCDATKVRTAVEKHVAAGAKPKTELPPRLELGKPAAENGAEAAGDAAAEKESSASDKAQTGINGGKKDLSGYAPGAGDVNTAPELTGQAHTGTMEPDPPTDTDELNKRIAELVKAAPVMLFMKGTPSAPQCGFSRTLVGLLRERGVRYGFFNILADEDVRQGLKVWADWPTFPQLWVGGELVGGLDIVKEEIENDPEFLNDYAVAKGQGGMAAPEAQKQPVAA